MRTHVAFILLVPSLRNPNQNGSLARSARPAAGLVQHERGDGDRRQCPDVAAPQRRMAEGH